MPAALAGKPVGPREKKGPASCAAGPCKLEQSLHRMGQRPPSGRKEALDAIRRRHRDTGHSRGAQPGIFSRRRLSGPRGALAVRRKARARNGLSAPQKLMGADRSGSSATRVSPNSLAVSAHFASFGLARLRLAPPGEGFGPVTTRVPLPERTLFGGWL